MRLPCPLLRGTLIQRYKRFLADVRLDDGQLVTATCPNTGSMIGLAVPGMVVWLSQSDKPTRKYRHTWELVEVDLGAGPTLVGINTGHPNKLVAEALEARRVRALAGYPTIRREVRYGRNSRIDLLLECGKKGLCYVEIKNVHLSRRHGVAEFPIRSPNAEPNTSASCRTWCGQGTAPSWCSSSSAATPSASRSRAMWIRPTARPSTPLWLPASRPSRCAAA